MMGTPNSTTNQRASNLIQHNNQQLLDDSQKSELFVCNGASPAEAMNCLKTKCPNHHHQYRNRCVSVTSQATLLTTVSKNDAINESLSRIDNVIALNSESESGPTTTKFYRRDEKSALGSIAEKLRRGTRKIMLFTTTGSSSPTSVSPSHISSKDEITVLGVVTQSKRTPKLKKDNSIDSAHTNTISNSSLQEVDAEEFDSAELAKYMGVVNKEINTMKCSSCNAVPIATSKTDTEGDDNPP